MSKLCHKGYSRCYVANPDDAAKVRAIIEQMDDFEAKYIPEGWITTFDQYPQVVYTGKFSDLDMNDLTAICFSQGIHIFVCDTGHEDMPSNAVKKFNTREVQVNGL